MLSEQEIQKALHAGRVTAVPISNPHGPLGLEHMAELVTQIQASTGTPLRRRGSAILHSDELEGMFFIHPGDESEFMAMKTMKSPKKRGRR